uniref:Cilia- and flagella-associated protein 300 n=2 Tax=Emiliania huxleyi TaxID=2903 RepID=A0A7S3WDQ7_EMIHU
MGSWTFEELPGGLSSLADKNTARLLEKWDLAANSQAARFRYSAPFEAGELDAFVTAFFNSNTVQAAAPVRAGTRRSSAAWVQLGRVDAVECERLSTTVVRRDIFDRLEERGIVRGGSIARCMDVPCGEMVIASDLLRLMLLDEGSEEWATYSDGERRELIFHLFRILAVGGGLNQWEDDIAPYIDMTTALYKVRLVHKDARGSLAVRSVVLRVLSVEGSAPLFPSPSSHHRCLLAIDPLLRHVTLFYHAFYPMM